MGGQGVLSWSGSGVTGKILQVTGEVSSEIPALCKESGHEKMGLLHTESLFRTRLTVSLRLPTTVLFSRRHSEVGKVGMRYGSWRLLGQNGCANHWWRMKINWFGMGSWVNKEITNELCVLPQAGWSKGFSSSCIALCVSTLGLKMNH